MDETLSDAQLLSLIKDYTEQLKHEPKADVFCQLAHCYLRLGLIDSAVTALQQGLVQHPHHVQGQVLLAEQCAEKGQYDEAVAGYEKVLQQHPDCVDALVGIAQLNLAQSNRDKAQLYIEKVRLLQPQHPHLAALIKQLHAPGRGVDGSVSMSLVTATVAELYYKQGLTEKAVDVYKTLVSRQPQNEVFQVRLKELLGQAESKHCTNREMIKGQLENWLGAIQRRRKNV